MNMLKKLGTIYSESLVEVISTVAGIHLQIECRKSDNKFDDITGVMILNAKENGILLVSAKAPDVRIICSKIIGIPPEEVTEDDMDDTMCELVNMTAGNAKLRLNGTDYMFTLSQPFVIKGKEVSIITKNITNIIASTVSDGEVTIKLKAIY